MYSTNGLWATLRGVVPNSTLSHIRLIRRVLQQNKEVRFDLFVTKERVDQTLSSLKRFMRHWLFYFRLHSQERLQFRPETLSLKLLLVVKLPLLPLATNTHVVGALPNINSFKGKRPHKGSRGLEGFCFLPNITCVCLPVAPGVSRE